MPIIDAMLDYLDQVIDRAQEEHYFDFIINLLKYKKYSKLINFLVTMKK